ncbi:LysR family transcriptional regulator [Lysinibacillus sp. PLM2]|nr:LysR family transcriptional regulator [Lysinibacillus sp. PLM2]
MSLLKYEIFNKVAEIGSFTRAGEILGLTQSAVSHAISSLEKELGFPLIHRSKTGLKLTNDGQTILNAIRQVLQAEELLKQEAANINGVTSGTVKIGTFSSISSKWMPILIKKMEQKYPGIRIELREGDYYEIEQMLIDGEIDCGFLNGTYSNQFHFKPLFRDRLLCIVSSSSPLYLKKSIDIEEVELEPFILTSYSGMNDVMTVLELNNVKPTIRFELYDETGIVSMVEHGLGISILPELVIKTLPPKVRAIPLKQNCYRTIGLATKQKLSPATKIFIEVLLNWLSSNEKISQIEYTKEI